MKKQLKVIVSVALVSIFLLSAGIFAYMGATNRLSGLMFNPRYPFKATVIFKSENMKLNGSTELNINWIELFKNQKTNFNNRLAKLSYLLCMDAHDNGLVTTEKVNNTNEKDNESFPKSLYFSSVKTFKVGDDATDNPNDTTTMTVSVLKYGTFQTTAMYINISFNATDASDNSEWSSNLDIGADCENYPGSATDWTTKANHKGFDVAATRAMKELEKYFGSLGVDYIDNVVVGINGYSRGAAIANIVASKFYTDEFPIDNDNATCFAYTFASPNTTTNSNRNNAKYNYIFNVISADDLVTQIPPASMGFGRYGKDVSFDLDDEANASARAAYKSIGGKAYKSGSLVALTTSLEELCSSREDYYTLNMNDATKTKTKSFTDETALINDLENTNNTIKGLIPVDTEKYAELSLPTLKMDFGGESEYKTHEYSLTVAPAFVSAILPSVLSSVKAGSYSMILPVYTTFSFGRYQSFISAFGGMMMQNSSLLRDMHYPAAYMAYIGSLD